MLGTEPRTIEEQYSSAAQTSDLTVYEHKAGPAHLLIASGLSARQDADRLLRYPDTPSYRLGAALARLQSEWHGCEKPERKQPRSIKAWMAVLPLKAGKRDRQGAMQAHMAERARLAAIHNQELKFLAQKLPSRVYVRETMWKVALHWGWEDAERGVAEVLQHWLDETCPTCHGTGELIVEDKVTVCHDCKGQRKTLIPRFEEGWRMRRFMEDCKAVWVQSVKAQLRGMRRAR
jgi:hypothetical protein